MLKYDDRPGPKQLNNGLEELQSEQTADFVDTCRTDIAGLLAYLDQLQRNGIRLLEATYIGNVWHWYDVFPFEHHGFVFSLSCGEYFSLDFGRNGIAWDIFDEYPDFPDNTFLVNKYRVDRRDDLRVLRQYCRDTQPFVYMLNDCKTWSNGLRQTLKMELMQTSPSAKDKDSRQQAPGRVLNFVNCM